MKNELSRTRWAGLLMLTVAWAVREGNELYRGQGSAVMMGIALTLVAIASWGLLRPTRAV